MCTYQLFGKFLQTVFCSFLFCAIKFEKFLRSITTTGRRLQLNVNLYTTRANVSIYKNIHKTRFDLNKNFFLLWIVVHKRITIVLKSDGQPIFCEMLINLKQYLYTTLLAMMIDSISCYNMNHLYVSFASLKRLGKRLHKMEQVKPKIMTI